jgi:hypothetical protein
MKSYYLFLTLIIFSFNIASAQFDTIAGPFQITGAMTAANEKIYLTSAQTGGLEILAIDVSTPDLESRSIFTNPFGTPIVGLSILEEDLYIAAAGATTAQGLIRRVTNINSETPTNDIYLDLPWLPTNLAIKDSVMYISRFFFFGGDIFTYDMRDPAAELMSFVSTDANSLTDFEIVGDQLLVSDGSDDRIYSIDLTAANPTLSTIQTGFDFPSGITVDGELLYVAVGNGDSNASSRVNVYELNSSIFSPPLSELATTTNLVILDVARINNATYVLEYAEGLGADGYLLRVQEETTATTSLATVPITAFPNPTSGLLTFAGLTPERVEVINSSGSRVKSAVSNGHQLDLSGHPAGIYTLLVYLADGTLGTTRVVKE